MRQQKGDYNREIKEYNNITKIILNEEKLLEDTENKSNKIKYKQKITFTKINSDFVKHFNDFADRICKEILDPLMDFFGYSITHSSLLKVL